MYVYMTYHNAPYSWCTCLSLLFSASLFRVSLTKPAQMKIGFVHVLFVALVSFLTVFLAVWAGEEAFLKSHPTNSPVTAPAPPSEEPKLGRTFELPDGNIIVIG